MSRQIRIAPCGQRGYAVQYHLPVITHQYEGKTVEQRSADGYINATAMCKAAGKEWAHYASNKQTKAFMEVLATKLGIPSLSLIEVRRGGKEPGTWVHPKVAIHLAGWLSPEFAVFITDVVHDWMEAKSKPGVHRLPYHLQRYLTNQHNVPADHFSVLVEMTQTLVAPLEACGVELPENVWPDISQGRMFCAWLRKQGFDPDTFPTYKHEFADGRPPVYPKAYPIELLAAFRQFVQNEWMPKRMPEYLAEKVPAALPHMARLLPPKKAA